MGNFTPSIPISLQIRNVIFDKFNNPDIRFTNDEIFDILQKNGDIEKSWTIDDVEPFFQEICDSGVVRNIAQNFTTIHLKLFDSLEKLHCNSCNFDICLGTAEKRICPNPNCKASI